MQKSFAFYAVVAGMLAAVVGLLIGLGFAGKWVAFFTIALLFILMFVLLSDMPSGQKSSR